MKTDTLILPTLTIIKSAGKYVFTAILAAVVLAVPTISYAELATNDEMSNVAQNWLTYIVDQTGDWGGSIAPNIDRVQDLIVDDTLLARYYSISSGGYIIVPVLKELPPVKAYSDQFSLDIYEADGFALLLRQILRDRMRLFAEVFGDIEVAQPTGQPPLFDFKNRNKWDQLAVSPKEFASTAEKGLMEATEGVGPLLTTAWHQGAPYNNLCPMGDGGRCVVGCVATAAAQIQNYHQWPPQGLGSHSYRWNGDNSCGGSTPSQTLSADFSDDYIYDGSAASVAEISYEMGVAFEMNYGACGSGAYTLYGNVVFPTYYRYDESARREYRTSHTSDSWFTLIKNNINKGRPILYRIYSHAIVCDGWRVSGGLDQYHFNYGWNSSHNTWYTVDNLYCPWSGCDVSEEAMVVNIIPKNGSPWLTDAAFADPLGNGNGIPEAGETVEMTVTVTNYGGAPIPDVSITLSIDDASLNIIEGSAYLGDINSNQSATNSDAPFVFDIPIDYISRLDSFFIEISWNGGAEVDTLIAEKAIGKVSILLVDDDENGNRDIYYEDCLADLRIPYHVWEFAAFSTPDVAYLSQYDIVIWFTGDYRSHPLSTNEIASMSGYLDNGGKLFLTGQRIAAQLNTLNPGFLNDYLKAEYIGTQNIPALSTQAGQVFDTGYMIAIQGGNSASNQTYPDLIIPYGGATAELKYLGSDYFGAVSYSGVYQSVFFSFGFEAVVSDDSRWRDRAHVMMDILDFFGYSVPNRCPIAADLSVSPGDPMHLLEHSPDISWSYSDHEASPQTGYQVQAGSDNNWMVAEMWDTGPVAGSESQITYAGSELLDGQRYYLRVRCFDGSLWSDWTYKEIRMNSVPAPATNLAPANMSGVSSATPTLSHTNAVDGESDVLTYDYEVYADAEMTILVDQKTGHPSGAGSTSWTVSAALEDDGIYYWRVRGCDPYEDGHWTEPASFWVNSVNIPPEAFDLVSPADETKLPGLSVTFVWEASSDTDPYDQVTYRLFYSTSPTFSPYTSVSNLDSTSYTPPGSLAYGTTYYWKVRAQDLFGGLTNSASVFSFTSIPQGDANGDGLINIADAVFLINFIFKGGAAPDPLASGDANCDGNPNIGDAVYLINYVFSGGPEPGCH